MQGKCYIDCVKRRKKSNLNINFIPLIYKFLPDISIYYYKFNFQKIILNICCKDIYLHVFTCVYEIEKIMISKKLYASLILPDSVQANYSTIQNHTSCQLL